MKTIVIKRYRLANFGPSGYRIGAAWNWSYLVQFPQKLDALGSDSSDQGRNLAACESWAKRFCSNQFGKGNFHIVRSWEQL